MALESWLLYSTDGVSYQQVVPALNTSRLEPLWITLAAPLKVNRTLGRRGGRASLAHLQRFQRLHG